MAAHGVSQLDVLPAAGEVAVDVPLIDGSDHFSTASSVACDTALLLQAHGLEGLLVAEIVD